MKSLTTLILGTVLSLGTAGLGFAADQPTPAAPVAAAKSKTVAKRHKHSKKSHKAVTPASATPTTPAPAAK